PALKQQREPRPRIHFPTPPARPLALELLPTPTAPTGVVAEAGIASARVSWTRPPQLVTGYLVIPHIGTTPHTPTPVAGSLQEVIVIGLTVGTSYTFTVKTIPL